MHAFLGGVGNATLKARLAFNLSQKCFPTLLHLRPEEPNDLVAGFDFINAPTLRLSLYLFDGDAEGAYKGLRVARIKVIVVVTG